MNDNMIYVGIDLTDKLFDYQYKNMTSNADFHSLLLKYMCIDVYQNVLLEI